jgi:hypothetical protein
VILAVYIPVEGGYAERVIRRGSAVVGTEREVRGERMVKLDFEGGLYNPGQTFEEKLMQAAGRHVENYPTRARLWSYPDEVLQVGTYDTERRVLLVTGDELYAWRGGQ